MKRYPEPAVGAFILCKDKLFLMKGPKWKGKYVIPGGHIELGEKIEDALRREIREETSLEIFNIRFLCFQEFIFDKSFWKKKHFIFLDYLAETDSQKVMLNDEADGFVWVTIEEALKLPLEEYTRRSLIKYIDDKGKLQ